MGCPEQRKPAAVAQPCFFPKSTHTSEAPAEGKVNFWHFYKIKKPIRKLIGFFCGR
jgi:hypothetical protein